MGMNKFAVEDEKPIPIQRIDEALERQQVERLRGLRERRDPAPWQVAIAAGGGCGAVGREFDAADSGGGGGLRNRG